MSEDKKDDILSTILNSKEENVDQVEVIPNKTSDEYEYAKDNMRSLIDKGMVVLDDLIAIARESGHPKAFAAVSEMMTVLTKANLDLMGAKEIQTKIQGVESDGETIHNTLILTTSDMQRYIEEARKTPTETATPNS